MRFCIQKILLYPSLFMIFITGCSQNKNHSVAPRTSEHLFELNLSPTELANRKRDFLNRTSLRHPGIINSRLVNLDDGNLNRGHTCPTPRIGTYGAPDGGPEVYCIQIPKEFRNNIPNEILREIILHDLDILEVFFIAQHRNVTYDPPSVFVFRVHNWVYPHIPATFHNLFNRDILMTLYPNSTIPLRNQIIERRLLPFNVNLHDGLISPDNAHTAIATAPAENFSFYSLVIDVPAKRAVVTLHWMVEAKDFLEDPVRNPTNYRNSFQYLNRNMILPTSIHTLIGRMQRLPHFTPAVSEPIRSLNALLH